MKYIKARMEFEKSNRFCNHDNFFSGFNSNFIIFGYIFTRAAKQNIPKRNGEKNDACNRELTRMSGLG